MPACDSGRDDVVRRQQPLWSALCGLLGLGSTCPSLTDCEDCAGCTQGAKAQNTETKWAGAAIIVDDGIRGRLLASRKVRGGVVICCP